jgi:hypothetical protein
MTHLSRDHDGGYLQANLPLFGTQPAYSRFSNGGPMGSSRPRRWSRNARRPKLQRIWATINYAPNKTSKAVAAGGVVLLTGTDDGIGDVFSEACERGCEEISLASGLARRFRPWKFYSVPKAGPWVAAIGPPAER